MALGYITGKASSRILNTELNLPLLLVASVIPDVDLVLQSVNEGLFMHRGPPHSIITFTALMIPFFIIYRKKAIPYYAALLSHSLIGDYFTGGIEMLWPISNRWYGFADVEMTTLAPMTAEIVLFAFTLVLMVKAKDMQTLFKPKSSNLWLIIAFGTVLGPMLDIGLDGFHGSFKLLLLAPSIFFLLLFGYSIVIGLRTRKNASPKATNDSG